MVGDTLGLHRIQHFEEIEGDPLLALKLALPKLPDYTILYKDLEKFDTPEKLASFFEDGGLQLLFGFSKCASANHGRAVAARNDV